MIHPTEIFLFVALVYFVFCTGLDLLAGVLTRNSSEVGHR